MKGNRTANAKKPASTSTRCQAIPLCRVLVVDDEVVLRHFIAHVLVGSGYQVDTAEDGESAWEALQAKNYDLLITDNNMPKVSGVELIKKLRSEDAGLPVIMISGAMPTEELNRHPWLQLAAALLKPFSGAELLGTVKKVLRETGGDREQIEPQPVWRSRQSAQDLRL